MRIDARIPLVFHPTEPRPDDHVLMEGEDFDAPPAPDGVTGASHALDCACCVPRSRVAGLLGGLFFARARGTVPFFRRVVAHTMTPEGRAAVEAALADDPVVSGCFRAG